MFFEKSAKDISPKWNINDFVIGNGNKSRGKSGGSSESKEEFELTNIIKKIESRFTRTEFELDSIYKDLKNKRKELRARFKALESDPENEASFHSLDVQLIMGQMKAIESKAKSNSDKLKHIRDEKKLLKDLFGKQTPETQVTIQNAQTNSPLSNIKPASGANIIRAGSSNMFDPAFIIGGGSKYELPKPTEPVRVPESVEVTPCEIGATNRSVAPTSKPEAMPSVDPVIITRNWDGTPLTDTTTVIDKRRSIIEERLSNSDNYLKNVKTEQGIDYNRSINAIYNKRVNTEKVVYVNSNSGEFWQREFRINEDGKREEMDTELFQSIPHIGTPELNIRARTAKTAYNDDAVDLVIVGDNSEMPEYYTYAWAEPDKARYKIPEEIISLL